MGPRRIVLIPTYNEAENVTPLLESIRAVFGADELSVLFIDDSSPDGTADRIQRIATSRSSGVSLLARPAKSGLGAAYLDGFRWVLERGEWDRVFMMDADLSHQPESLPALDSALEENDLVIGSRYTSGVSVLNWSIARLNMSYAANAYIRMLTGMPFRDCTSGYRAFRSDLTGDLLSLAIRASGYAFLVEMLFRLWRSDRRVGEVPIVFVERKRGSSKVSMGVFLESLMLPLRLGLGRLLGAGGGGRRPQ
ncbi:polyprenol monophosphomannose synthase [Candidatus Fermentibacterales bacterium]|nr:polyprenol monophosphomannose synthase [Candidatus Fermentibacterales bacterium]